MARDVARSRSGASASRFRVDDGRARTALGVEGLEAVSCLENTFASMVRDDSDGAVEAFLRKIAESPIGREAGAAALDMIGRAADECGRSDLAALADAAVAARSAVQAPELWLLKEAAALVIASGDDRAVAQLAEDVAESGVTDATVVEALDHIAREAGRAQLYDLEMAVLAAGAERLFYDDAFRWRASRAAHRAGDYVFARQLAAESPPQIDKDRRVERMLEDFEALRILPEEVEILTRRPRAYVDHAGAAGSEATLYYVADNALPHSTGGYATRTHGLVRALQRLGLSAVVGVKSRAPAKRGGPPAEQVHKIAGVAYHYAGQPLATGRFSRISQLTEATRAAIELEKPDIVHAASNFEIGLSSILAASELGIPAVYEVRGFWEITRLSDSPDFAGHPLFRRNMAAEIATCLLADHVVTLNEAMKDLIVSCGVPEEAVSIVPNAAPTEVFYPRTPNAKLSEKFALSPDDVVIGYVGSFLAYEGIEQIIEAFDRLAGDRKNLKVLLVGDHEPTGPRLGTYWQELNERVARSPFRDRIILAPRVPYAEVPEYYSLIDICPFPRHPRRVTELITPMKPNEALAMGKAVAVSDVGGLRDLVTDGETGMIFASDDVDAMTRCLALLADDAALRATIADAGHVLAARNRSWSLGARRLIEVYDRLLDGGSRHADPAIWREAGLTAARLLDADADADIVDAVIENILV